MELKTIVSAIVATIIMVSVSIAVLIPTVSESTSETFTYVNEGIPFASVDDGTHVITVAYVDGSLEIVTDGKKCEVPTTETFNIVYGANSFTRITVSSSTLRVWNGTSSINDQTITSSPITITITNDGATVTGASIALTNVLAYIAEDGNYVMSASPKATKDTNLIGTGQTFFGGALGTSVYLHFSGTLEDLYSTIVTTVGKTATISSVDTNTRVIKGELEQIDSIVFNLDIDGTSAIATYTNYLVEKNVTYANPTYAGDVNSALINIIPIMVLVGLVLGVVGTMVYSRD